MYEVQLNAYAAIGQRCGFDPVTDLALIYMEQMTNGHARLNDQCRDSGFDMGFSAHVLPVDLNLDRLGPLLVQTRELFELPSPPAGLKGCKDCELTERLVALVAGDKVESRPRDQGRRAVNVWSSRSESTARRG